MKYLRCKSSSRTATVAGAIVGVLVNLFNGDFGALKIQGRGAKSPT